jgi:uncharacterized protein (TIGR02466 family)
LKKKWRNNIMTYQYQEVKKTDPRKQANQQDLFEQYNTLNPKNERIKYDVKGQDITGDDKVTGYEPGDTPETRARHNKRMEELYGIHSPKQKTTRSKRLKEHEQTIADQSDNVAKEHQKDSDRMKKQKQGLTAVGDVGLSKRLIADPIPGTSRGLASQTLFPTIIHRGSLPIADKLNPPLVEHCYKMQREWKDEKQPNLCRSVKNGWQSKPDIHNLPELQDFNAVIRDAISWVYKQIQVPTDTYGFALDTVWYNITPTGGHNENHVHPGSFISGCYYIKKPPLAGNLVIYDPRKGSQCSREPEHLARGSIQVIKGQEGDIILFPGWLEHSVEPNRDKEDRISIAFNASWNYLPGHGYMEDFIENKQKQADREQYQKARTLTK